MKWEYKIDSAVQVVGSWAMEYINKLGEEGWEAVSAFYDSKLSQTYILFKRAKNT